MLTHDKVVELAKKYFGDWKSGNYKADIPAEPKQKETRFTHVKNSNFPPVLSLNYKGPAFSDTKIDMPAIDVMNTILFSSNSALYKKLVIDEQKARNISGGASDSRDPNLITIIGSTN